MKSISRQFVRQAGFTLVELMVAMAIGMIVILGLMVAFDANRENFRFNNQMLQLHDSGRFALDSIIQDLRMAGDAGCIRSSLDGEDNFNTIAGNIIIGAGVPFNATQLVQGVAWNNVNRRLEIYGIPVAGSGLVLSSNCINSWVDVAANPRPGTDYRVSTGMRTYTYTPPAGVATGTLTVSDPVIGDDQMLLENVEHFAVCFGVDDAGVNPPGSMQGTVSQWVPRAGAPALPTAAQLQQTIAVQVQMVVASEPQGAGTSGQILSTPQAINANFFNFCDGTSYPAAAISDQRLRKFFSSTAVLRNKVPNGYGTVNGWL